MRERNTHTIVIICLFITLLIFISGCYDGVVYLNSTSAGECLIQCREQTKQYNYHCMNADAIFGTTIKNGVLTNNTCECILLDCFKEIGGK